MKCIIRDDDTCGLTTPDELDACYGFLPDNMPVCLSVTPFRIPGPLWDIDEARENTPVPLADNPDTVAWLREQTQCGRVDVALHGYQHSRTTIDANGKILKLPDYADKSKPWWREFLYGNQLHYRATQGKRYLEELIGHPVYTFVPPGNQISKQGLEALIENGLNLIGPPKIELFGAKHRPLNPRNQYNAIRRKAWTLVNRSGKYPFVMDFGDHQEIGYYLLYPSTSLSDLKRQVDIVDSVDGTMILSTHYYAFDNKISSGETIAEALHTILDYINGKAGARFITYRELWGL